MYEQRRFDRRDSSEPPFNPERDRIKKILDGDARELNRYAEEKAKHLAAGRDTERLSTSQVRSILDELHRMSKFDDARLQMMRPRLAYAAGRHKGKVKDMQAILDIAIEMTDSSNFHNLRNLVEAIVAYHRYHGGK